MHDGEAIGNLPVLQMGDTRTMCIMADVSDIFIRLTRSMAHLPIAMTWVRAIEVVGMAALMCTGAAFLSVRKVTASDPASLF